jgi:hypothetical protein
MSRAMERWIVNSVFKWNYCLEGKGGSGVWVDVIL